MSDKPAPARPTVDLRLLTPARVALGRNGASLPTRPLLDFTLAHARARDAVHAAFGAAHLAAGVRALGLAATEVSSRAADRRDYLRRPDLGRQLDASSAAALAEVATAPRQLAIVIGDGLSAASVHAHAVALLQNCCRCWARTRLSRSAMSSSPQARGSPSATRSGPFSALAWF